MQRVIDHLNSVLIERDDALRALALSVLCQEHAVFLGETGTGKTFMMKALAKAMGGLSRFMTQVHPSASREEVVGPIDMKAIAEEIRYNTANMAPECQIVLIDEVFKWNWSGLNSLLSMMQERIFYNGSHQQQVPLITLVGTSNEMPREGGLEAFWDRFLVRDKVEDIKDPANFQRLLEAPPSIDDVHAVIDAKELAEQQEAAAAVTVPSEVLDRVVKLREELRSIGIVASARRWAKAIPGEPPHAGLAKASAFLDGRTTVTVEDLEVLSLVCWQHPGQIAEVQGVVVGVANPIRQAVREATDMAYGAYTQAIDAVKDIDAMAKEAKAGGGETAAFQAQASNALMQAIGSIREAKLQLDRLAEDGGGLTGRSQEVVEKAAAEVQGWQADLLKKLGV